PLMRWPMRKAPIWAGVEPPVMIERMAALICSGDKSWPRAMSSRISASIIGSPRLFAATLQESSQHVVAKVGQNRFRMELHAFGARWRMNQPHDFVHVAVVTLGPGGDLEIVRQPLAGHDQGMVARGGQ